MNVYIWIYDNNNNHNKIDNLIETIEICFLLESVSKLSSGWVTLALRRILNFRKTGWKENSLLIVIAIFHTISWTAINDFNFYVTTTDESCICVRLIVAVFDVHTHTCTIFDSSRSRIHTKDEITTIRVVKYLVSVNHSEVVRRKV